MSYKILFIDPLTPSRMEALGALAFEGFTLATTTGRDEATQLAAVADADFLISGDLPITRAMLQAGTRLKGVHKWGVGIDNFDLDAARDHGVRVMRTTGSNAIPVAETALALIMATSRGILAGHQGMQRGEWLKGAVGVNCFMLTGKTVGLVGLGAIAKSLARILSGFGCRVLYTKPTPIPEDEARALHVEHVDLDTLLRESDIVSLHCALTPQTRGLIAAPQLAAMKRTAILINVARGGVVVEADLVDALRAGTIRAAGVDVFETEPADPANPLLHLPNCVCTPHIGAAAADNFAKTVTRMFTNIACVARGEEVAALDLVV